MYWRQKGLGKDCSLGGGKKKKSECSSQANIFPLSTTQDAEQF